jgi:hypothetical protein
VASLCSLGFHTEYWLISNNSCSKIQEVEADILLRLRPKKWLNTFQSILFQSNHRTYLDSRRGECANNCGHL